MQRVVVDYLNCAVNDCIAERDMSRPARRIEIDEM